MKTRRILAASTAALLSFASVAVVASAADPAADDVVKYSNVTIALKEDANVSFTSSTKEADLDNVLDIKATTVALEANTGDDKDKVPLIEGEPKNEQDVSGDAKVTWSSDGISWTAKVELTAKDTAATVVTASKNFKIQFTDKETAPLGSSKGNEILLADGVTATAPKDSNKTMKDYKIKAKSGGAVVGDSDDEDALIDVEESPVIKGLNAKLKEEFAAMKPGNVKLLNIEVSKDGFVESKTPAAITLKATVKGFKPAGVYHVDGEDVNSCSVKAINLKEGTDDEYVVTFESKYFSPFIITSAKLKNTSAAPADASDADASTDTSDDTTSPETGIALAIAPVVLAAGAVAVVALKKKH